MSERAIVRNEGTGAQPYFVYIERDGHGATFAARFASLASAERIAALINRVLKQEGRA